MGVKSARTKPMKYTMSLKLNVTSSAAAATTRSGRRTTEYGFLDHGPKAFGFATLVDQWSQYPKYVVPLGP